MEAQITRIHEIGSQRAIKTALAIVSDLATVTPVDTSQALSNWQVSLNTPVGNIIDAYYTGSKGSTQELSAVDTIRKAREVLSHKKPGEDIHISNLLRYIAKLNEGSSKQEPAGFVERAVLIGRIASKQA